MEEDEEDLDGASSGDDDSNLDPEEVRARFEEIEQLFNQSQKALENTDAAAQKQKPPTMNWRLALCLLS